jgi:Ran GTPase-activating protein (RanGAP) involved in mRNA processing and transport/Ca2+-binding EF-hand superfamily protein
VELERSSTSFHSFGEDADESKRSTSPDPSRKRACLQRSSHNGLFTDFLVRSTSKARQVSGENDEAYLKNYIEESTENTMSADGKRAIMKEELLTSLSYEINLYEKGLDASTAVAPSKFKELSGFIVKMEREGKCLRDEVRVFLSTRRALQRHKELQEQEFESQGEKKARVKDFWVQFHTGKKREGLEDKEKDTHKEKTNHAQRKMIRMYTTHEMADSSGDKLVRLLKASQEQSVKEEQHAKEEEARRHSGQGRRRSSAGLTFDQPEEIENKLEEPAGRRRLKKAEYPPLCWPDPWKQRGARDLHRSIIDREDRTLPKLQETLSQLEHSRSKAIGMHCGQPQALSISAKWRKEGNGAKQKTLEKKSVSLPSLHPKAVMATTLMAPKSASLSNLHEATLRPGAGFSPKASANGEDIRFSAATRLPPMGKDVQMPWGQTGRNYSSSAQEYLKACQEAGVIPNPSPFVTGKSTRLYLEGSAVNDVDLLPVVRMLQHGHKIEEIDLGGNGLLSEVSLCPLLKGVLARPCVVELRKINLQNCLRSSDRRGIQNVIDMVVRLISDDHGAKFLQHIDLSGINPGMKSQILICQAIRQHSYLREVRLADIGLQGPVAQQCVEELMKNPTLQHLDLGWNCFGPELFKYIGECIVQAKRMESLCVANCSAAFVHKGDNPIGFLSEQLCRDGSLTRLDLSMNRLDFRGALVLEDALCENKTLTELDVSHNPLGVLGLRSVFRLLSRDSDALLQLNCKDCSSSLDNDVAAGIQQFNMTNPAGRFVLHLHRPYHRAMLRMFYRTCARFGLPAETSLTNLEYSSGKYTHASRDSSGIWVVPSSGRLRLTFSMDAAMEVFQKDVPPHDFNKVLDKHWHTMKLNPSLRKIGPLFGLWKEMSGNAVDEIAMLDALSKDYLFTYPHLKQLCQNRMMKQQIISKLLPCVTGGYPARFLTLMLLSSPTDHLLMLKANRNFLNFNPQNPTGHYELDLYLPGDYSVACNILILDRWEAILNRKNKVVDTSQRGNGSRVRNERFANVSMQHLSSLAEWSVPEIGILELDYASSKRPSKNCAVMNDAAFTKILSVLEGGALNLAPKDQLEAMRMVSHRMFITAMQMREILGVFRDSADREDVYIMYFMQVVDMYNEKLFRVRFESLDALTTIQNRLGLATNFPYVQLEQTCFRFNFSKHDERLAANALMCICSKEGWKNIQDYTYTHADGVVDPLLAGIPRSWESLDKMPRSGIFAGRYNCSPDERCYKVRAHYFKMYSFWEAPEKEDAVTWWAVPSETPEDILEFLEFLSSRFDNVSKAFKAIDGEDGNGQITKNELLQGIRKMGCKKFKEVNEKGQGEEKRVEAMFRYLDVSSEGEVNEAEFHVLDLLFQEIQLSIREFVKFLVRTFGTDLATAWKVFDESGDGEVDFDEWMQELTTLGFFGASKTIFNYLDKDDEGTISLDEFECLMEFSEPDVTFDKRRASMKPDAEDMEKIRQSFHAQALSDSQSLTSSKGSNNLSNTTRSG